MKSLLVRLSLLTVVLFCVAFVTPAIASAAYVEQCPVMAAAIDAIV